jgi:magnesium-transporting ATPase (P-type)
MYVVVAVIPPLLPTVFTVSVGVSDDRLSRKRITTANAAGILIAGKVTRAFFDKTGTLTRQGLDFIAGRSTESLTADVGVVSERLRMAMATCHSLTQSSDGRLIGNPVDQNMLQASGASLLPSRGNVLVVDSKGNQLEVVRHFDFDHVRMTQSVVVKLPDNTLVAFVKGSGESLQRICQPSSLPVDFAGQLQTSARAGIYQISVGSKPLTLTSSESVVDLTRDAVECDLLFEGVLDFQNVMRPEAPDVIHQLAQGEVVSTMVTGDSVQTGIRIAMESGIMDGKDVVIGSVTESGELAWAMETGVATEFPLPSRLERGEMQVAMSGRAWMALLASDPEAARQLAPYVRVFGRCTPQDKVSVVRTFVDMGYVTLMCGDGGNDTGALKAAHVGVALSDAEASMVAPFASLDKEIGSVLDVLKEGRCALASSLASYKYMICYGQIQSVNQVSPSLSYANRSHSATFLVLLTAICRLQIIGAYYQITFSEWCWVFMDGT